MQGMTSAKGLLLSGGLALILLMSSVSAHAEVELILDAELRGIYEDNVIGILSDQQKASLSPNGGRSGSSASAARQQGPGGSNSTSPYLGSGSSAQKNDDYSLLILGELGVGATVAKDTALFAIANVENTTYSSYSDFNSTIVGANTGFVVGFGPVFSFKSLAFARYKDFGDSQRDGNSYGGAIELKQRPVSWFTLKEAYEYEDNHAKAAFFTYTGHQAGAGIGLTFWESWQMNLGYTYLLREYEEPTDFRVISHMISAGLRKTFFKSLQLSIGYAREMSQESQSHTRSDNNIYSIGIRYSY